MNQHPGDLNSAVKRLTAAFSPNYLGALGALGCALMLAVLLGTQPLDEPSRSRGLYSPPWLVGVALFALLYAVFALLAHRMQRGVYRGFQHSAVIGAYLTLGPVAALTATVLGVVVTEIGRYMFGQWLSLQRHSLVEASSSLLFNVAAHTFSALVAGLLYQVLGGVVPLISVQPRLIIPLAVLLAANLLLYGGAVAFNTGQWRTTPNRLKLIVGLMMGEFFSLPLALLLPIAFYELPPLAFLLLVGTAVLAAFLFRVTERSRSALERRVEELATLNEIGHSMASSLAMDDLMQSIYNQVAALMEASYFYIALYSADTQTLNFPFAVRDGQKVTQEPYQSVNGPVEYIFRTREPLLVRGRVNDEFVKLGIDPIGQDCACYLAVPLVADDEFMGVLGVQSLTRPDAYSESDLALLTAVAGQAAIALHNAALYNRVWEMADELALLNNVSSVVAATLDLDIVLDTTCAVVIQIGRADKTAIFLTSEDRQTLRLVHSIGLSDDYVAQFQHIRLEEDSGPTQILQQHEAVAIPDVWTDPRGLGWRSLAEVEGYVGLLTVPLIASDQVIGFLAAFYQQPHLFGKSELDLMNTLANQVAVTVANARLYQDTQARAQEMERLVVASRAFTASLDLNSVAEKVLEELIGILSPDVIVLTLTDGDGLRPLAHRGAKRLDMIRPVGSIASAINNSQAMLLPAESADLDLLRSLGLHSLYVIPMVSQDRVIGAVLVGHEQMYVFSPRQRQMAEALVNQAATALRNAQLYRQTDAALADRVTELSAIESISRQISGSLDLDAIIDAVLDTALNITQADSAGCGLILDPEYVMLSERFPAASGRPPIRLPVKRGSGITDRVLRTGVAARVGDVRQDPDFQIGEIPDVLSELCVPIVHKGERVGLLNLESTRLDAFTESHERFIANLADHAAIAIENARLFEERRVQIDTLIKIRDLSLALLSATSLREVMDLIVEYALIIAHAKDVHLYLYDPPTDQLTFGASIWLDGQRNVEASPPERGGSTWQVARSGSTQVIEDTAQLEPVPQFRRGPGFGAVARIALKRGGQVLGVLVIAFQQRHYFTESESRALDLLANQSAIAIENVRLFDEVRAGRDRMQLILDSALNGMMLIDAGGQLVLANPAAEQLLTVPLQRFAGQHILRVIARARQEATDPAAFASLREAVHTMLGSIKNAPNQVVRTNFEIKHLEGTSDVEATLMPVRDNKGRISGWLAVLRDVSEEKTVERFRWEATNMIVHDLRSPLSAVISSLRLVQEMVAARDFTDLDEVVSIALNSSENQMRMIESILEIAKLETGRMPMNIDIVPLPPLVRRAISAIEVLATASNIRVTDCVPPNLPPLHIDEEQIRRVLINLLDNALRHTPADGEVRVEAAIVNGKGFAKIGVVDTGKGVPIEARERIFEKFYQMSQSALRGHRGVGLGLTFCRLSIEAHGGRIWVEDGPEGGAAFWFTLPVAVAVPQP